MYRILLGILFIVISLNNSLNGQVNFGLEARTSLNKTFNKGEIKGANFVFSQELISEVADPRSPSYSIGLLAELNNGLLFKLHKGAIKMEEL